MRVAALILLGLATACCRLSGAPRPVQPVAGAPELPTGVTDLDLSGLGHYHDGDAHVLLHPDDWQMVQDMIAELHAYHSGVVEAVLESQRSADRRWAEDLARWFCACD